MTQALRAGLSLAALAALLAGCGAVHATGQGVAGAGNALTGASTSVQQQVHQATGAATQ